MRRNIRRAAQAVGAHAQRQYDYRKKHVEIAVVRSINPLSAELVEARFTLSENELLLGWAARKYDQDHGIKKGDSLIVVEVSGDDYVVLDVHPTGEVLKGAATVVVPTAGDLVMHDSLSGVVTVAGGHVVIGKMKVYDADGVVVGWIPVYDDLP